RWVDSLTLDARLTDAAWLLKPWRTMISSFSDAASLMFGLPHPRSCLWNGAPLLSAGDIVSPDIDSEGLVMQIAGLGNYLGQDSCSNSGLDVGRAVVLRRRMRREGIIKLAAKLKPCVVAMEACCGAHHLGRVLRAQGHEVRLMSAEYV